METRVWSPHGSLLTSNKAFFACVIGFDFLACCDMVPSPALTIKMGQIDCINYNTCIVSSVWLNILTIMKNTVVCELPFSSVLIMSNRIFDSSSPS